MNFKIMLTLKAILATAASHRTSTGIRQVSAFTATNIRRSSTFVTHLPNARRVDVASFLQTKSHEPIHFKNRRYPASVTALFTTKTSNDDKGEDKPSKAKKSKKVKINPNWEKDYDKDALTVAFDEMAKKEGFDDSLAFYADDETFEDDFDYDEFDEDNDDDDDYLDFGSDDDSGEKNLQNKQSMAERIAAAKRDIDLGKVSVSDDIDDFARSATQEQLKNIGFKRELNPYGPFNDETPRQEAFKLVTDARTCSACGSAFQSKDPTRPGYLPPAKHEIQMKLVKIEEMQKLQEKAEAFEWSAEDEIEWLIQTSGEENPDASDASPSDIDIAKMADELGLDLAELSKKKTICKRCHGLQNFGTVEESLRPGHTEEPLLSQEAFRDLLTPIREKTAVIIALVDLFDFSGSVLPELDSIAGENPVILAANKADLLPSKMGQTRAENWVRRELEYLGVKSIANVGGAVRLVSCKTGFGVSSMMAKARELAEEMDCDIYVVGAANAGKSTLINHILEKNEERRKNFTKKRPGNANSRKGVVTTSPLPGTTLKFIKVDLGGLNLYDTPGLLVPGTLTQLLTPEELKIVVPKK